MPPSAHVRSLLSNCGATAWEIAPLARTTKRKVVCFSRESGVICHACQTIAIFASSQIHLRPLASEPTRCYFAIPEFCVKCFHGGVGQVVSSVVEATGRKGGKLYASQRQTTMGVALKAVPRPLRKWLSTKVAGVDRCRQIIHRMNLTDIFQAHAKNIQKLSASTFMFPPLSIASFLQRRLTGDIMLKAGSLRCSRLAKKRKRSVDTV